MMTLNSKQSQNTNKKLASDFNDSCNAKEEKKQIKH